MPAELSEERASPAGPGAGRCVGPAGCRGHTVSSAVLERPAAPCGAAFRAVRKMDGCNWDFSGLSFPLLWLFAWHLRAEARILGLPHGAGGPPCRRGEQCHP